MGGIPILIDSESGFYKPRATQIGVDLSKLVMFDAPYIEKGVEGLKGFLDAIQLKPALQGRPIVIAWDTLAAANTKNEFESGVNAGGMAEKARVIRQLMRDLTNRLPGFNAHFIMVNQVGATMSSYGKQTDTSGGWGPRFHASVRLELTKAGVYNDPYKPDEVAGIVTRIHVVKSKLFRPLATIEVPLNSFTGFDNWLSLVQFHATRSKVIKISGGRYYCADYFGDSAPGRYLRDFLDTLKEDDLLQDYLKNKAKEHVGLFWKRVASEKEK
jgi:RecA/RadA recombinase